MAGSRCGRRRHAAADHRQAQRHTDAYLKRPDVQDRLNALAITPLTSTPEELGKIHPDRNRKVGESGQGPRIERSDC